MFSISIETANDMFMPLQKGFINISIETSNEQYIMLQVGMKGIQIELDYYGFATKTKHK